MHRVEALGFLLGDFVALQGHHAESFGLDAGQDLPGELFGGVTPGTIGKKGKHCYLAEAIQDRQHKALNDDRTWQMGLLRHGDVYNGRLKHVTLKRFDDNQDWELKAAKRLGC